MLTANLQNIKIDKIDNDRDTNDSIWYDDEGGVDRGKDCGNGNVDSGDGGSGGAGGGGSGGGGEDSGNDDGANGGDGVEVIGW